MATFSSLKSLGDHIDKDDGRLQATGPNRVRYCCTGDFRSGGDMHAHRAPSLGSLVFFTTMSR